MFEKISKYILLIALFFVVGCGGSGFFSTVEPTGRSPFRQISIMINEEEYPTLFTQLENFSKEHDLRYVLSFYDAREIGKRFSVVMYETAFNITTLSPLSLDQKGVSQLDFAFTEEYPKKPISQELVDEIYNDLKAYLIQIPSVVIVEEK